MTGAVSSAEPGVSSITLGSPTGDDTDDSRDGDGWRNESPEMDDRGSKEVERVSNSASVVG